MRTRVIEDILERYPKQRADLPLEYKEIYNQHYYENREGKTSVSRVSQWLEGWLHHQIARTAKVNRTTLDVGAGTLNQLKYEEASKVYDIVEPFQELYEKSEFRQFVTNVYSDITEVSLLKRYDRIIACASFEHICDLPTVVERCAMLLEEGGRLCVSIPNEGRFLWKFAYTLTTGREFKKRFGLDYSVLMEYEHVNSADEIECILKHNFRSVKRKLLGLGKNFSFYRYYECRDPKIRNDKL